MDKYSNNKQIKALNPVKEYGPPKITKRILVYMPFKQNQNVCVYSLVDLTESGNFDVFSGEIQEIMQEYKYPDVTIIRCAQINVSKNSPNKKEKNKIKNNFYLILNSCLYDYKFQLVIKEKVKFLSMKTPSQNIVGLEDLIDEIKSKNYRRRQKKKRFSLTPEQQADIQSYKEVLGVKYKIDEALDMLKIDSTISRKLLNQYILLNRKLSIEDYEECIKIKKEINSLEELIHSKDL